MPTLAVAFSALRSSPLDHRAGFHLSLLDGAMDLESLLDVCAMPAVEALSLLTELEHQGFVRWQRSCKGPYGR